jgi:hypothetical protein
MGRIGVKGLFPEYGEYSSKYSPTPSLKPLSWVRIFLGVFTGYAGFCVCTASVPTPYKNGYICSTLPDTEDIFEIVYMTPPCEG